MARVKQKKLTEESSSPITLKPAPHQELHLKARPLDFSDMVGQDHVCKVIEAQIKDGTLPHTLLFQGPSGTGKTTLARIIASKLNPSPHGIFERDSGSEMCKDDVRLILQDAYNKPMVGDKKTYIFDEAHGVTRDAFIALLKITEEAPRHVHFILVTTDFEKIPLTIKSRCQIHCFSRIPNALVKQRLETVLASERLNLPEELISLTVDASGGSLRTALVCLETVIASYTAGQTEISIANVLGIIGAKRLSDFVVSAVFSDPIKLLELAEVFKQDKVDQIRSISDLQQFVMDCRWCIAYPEMSASVKSDVSYFLEEVNRKFGSQSPEKQREFRKTVGAKLDKLYDLSLDLETNFRRTSNKDSLLNRFVIRVCKEL